MARSKKHVSKQEEKKMKNFVCEDEDEDIRNAFLNVA